MKAELKFSAGRDLLDRIKSMNEFRNTKIAHQESPLTNPADAKAGLVSRIEALNRLWQAGNPEDLKNSHRLVRAKSRKTVLTLARKEL